MGEITKTPGLQTCSDGKGRFGAVFAICTALCSSVSNRMVSLLLSHMPISRAASELFPPSEYCLAQNFYTILWKFPSPYKTAGCCRLPWHCFTPLLCRWILKCVKYFRVRKLSLLGDSSMCFHHFLGWNELMLFLPTAEVFSQGGIFKPTPGVHAVFLFNSFPPLPLGESFSLYCWPTLFSVVQYILCHIYRSLFLHIATY